MRQKISAELRRSVAERAGFRCEYCRLREDDFYDFFQIDHIRSLKHAGQTELKNLAFSCPDCNAYKGSDIGTFLGDGSVITRFYNPRTDDWFEHFEVVEGAIYAQTDIGEATIRILRLNDLDRIIIRQELTKDGLYP